jgi:hypothetical protein
LEVPRPEPAAVKPAREIPANDARHAARRRVLYRASLAFGQNYAFSLDCVIHDLSQAGARVQIELAAEIPSDVTLVHLRDHAAYESTVAWRRRESVGIKFMRRHDLNDPSTPELEVLRRYCVENDPRTQAPPTAM